MEELKKNNVVYEKTNKIKIEKNGEEKTFSDNYYLKYDFFDPSKSSPPNTFLINLYNRYNRFSTINKSYSNELSR